MTSSLGQSQVIPYLTGLTKKGHDITILSCEKKVQFAKHKDNIKTIFLKNNIRWEPIQYTSHPAIISTIWDVYKLRKKSLQLNTKMNFDIVHCRSYIASLVGLYLKNRFNTKFIFDMRGFWADERFDGNIWNNKNILHNIIFKYFKNKEKSFLINADYTISLTTNAKKEILLWKHIPNQPVKIEVIPCCVDQEVFSISKINHENLIELKEELKITNEDFVLSYLGSIGTWYMLDEMLLFFKQLLKKKPTAKFLFITTEPKELIIKSAGKHEIPIDRIIVQKASREEVPVLLSLSKLSIFFIKPVFSKKASSPTKFAEVLSMGIPVICNSKIGDIDSTIEQTGCGALIDNFSNDEYDRVINNMDKLILTEKNKISLVAKKYFSLEKAIEQYNEIYIKM